MTCVRLARWHKTFGKKELCVWGASRCWLGPILVMYMYVHYSVEVVMVVLCCVTFYTHTIVMCCSMSSLQTVQATVAVTYKEVPKINGETFSQCWVIHMPWLHLLAWKGSSDIDLVWLPCCADSAVMWSRCSLIIVNLEVYFSRKHPLGYDKHSNVEQFSSSLIVPRIYYYALDGTHKALELHMCIVLMLWLRVAVYTTKKWW